LNWISADRPAARCRQADTGLDRAGKIGFDLSHQEEHREGHTTMADALIIDACRTPRGIGKAGKGALSGIHPQQLGATVLRALAERTGIDTADVDDIVWGTAAQLGPQSGDLGRMSALDAGYDVRASGVTLDRFCGSGITSVAMAANSIMAGSEDLVIAGGTEMMSMEGRRGNGPFMMDAGNLRLRARHPQSHQGVCADAIATMEGIARADVDQFGFESQKRAANAIANGYFNKSLVPVYREDGSLALDREEYPRPQTTLEGLAALKPAFPAIADFPIDDKGTTYRGLILQKHPGLEINHMHHAGNSSGVVDGSAANQLTTPNYAKAHGLKPRARVVATANIGDSPTLMLNAPVPATRKVLAKAGLTIDDIDLFEINEAFAVVAEKFIRDLKLDRAKVNVNGGSIALGHPIGATGSILIGTVLDELERRDLKRGLVTMCAAGGMAPAIIIERV
jgi:acetyl-CoA C-acetyltransferase